jgi:hypothetical protein
MAMAMASHSPLWAFFLSCRRGLDGWEGGGTGWLAGWIPFFSLAHLDHLCLSPPHLLCSRTPSRLSGGWSGWVSPSGWTGQGMVRRTSEVSGPSILYVGRAPASQPASQPSWDLIFGVYACMYCWCVWGGGGEGWWVLNIRVEERTLFFFFVQPNTSHHISTISGAPFPFPPLPLPRRHKLLVCDYAI